MSEWSDAYKPALNVEEAALLPARNRSLAGKSALQDTMRRAAVIGEKQVSNVVSSTLEMRPMPERRTNSCPCSRAALHQVRPNW